jgi:hypothetical protein
VALAEDYRRVSDANSSCIVCEHTKLLDREPSPVSASDYTHGHYMYLYQVNLTIY